MRRLVRNGGIAILLALTLGVSPLATGAADFFATSAFERQWQADEARIPNYWGPLANSPPPLLEPYKGATTGVICRPGTPCILIAISDRRTVQYFDKGRMEQPMTGSTSVTSGLLATELVRGKIQTGDTQFEDRTPPNIAIAGDADNPTPTYAQLATTANTLLAPAAQKNGGFVTIFINAQGQAEDGGGFAGISMTPPITGYDAPTMHNVLGVFGAYRDRAGFLTIGNAISEPFRANVKVGGQQATVLVQVFERRVLTYNNNNPEAFKVEMGNIGQHYYTWRYPSGPPPNAQGVGGPTSDTGNMDSPRDTVTKFFQALQANADTSVYLTAGAQAFYKGKNINDTLGITAPLTSFAIECERDTQLQVGTAPVRDVIVVLKAGGADRRVIVRMQKAPELPLIQGIISAAPSGDPIPASLCAAS